MRLSHVYNKGILPDLSDPEWTPQLNYFAMHLLSAGTFPSSAHNGVLQRAWQSQCQCQCWRKSYCQGNSTELFLG